MEIPEVNATSKEYIRSAFKHFGRTVDESKLDKIQQDLEQTPPHKRWIDTYFGTKNFVEKYEL